MIDNHSPWPLFCDDLNLAQKWVSSRLERNPNDKELGHQALSLGLTEMVKELINNSDLNLQDVTKRQWKFRIARLSGKDNPYSELIPLEMQNFTDTQVERARRISRPVVVDMVGGIGDHLELISMLLAWNNAEKHPVILQVTPQRQKDLASLVASIPQLNLQSNIDPKAVPAMAMREWICRHYESVCYSAWMKEPSEDREAMGGTLCCWKAKGEDNKLSSYLRSVPFPKVLEYYKIIRNFDPNSSLIDISEWKSDEVAILKGLDVQCINPRTLGLKALAENCRHKKIITIDTALAHLCAVTGIEAMLLLNIYHDERWIELSKPGNCYSDYLKVFRQTQFCNWEDILRSLTNY